MEVYPIRDVKKINAIKKLMKADEKIVLHSLFTCGLNCALRVGDLLQIKFEDIKGSHIQLKEQKTGKTKVINLNPAFLQAVDALKKYYRTDIGYLFRPTGNRAGKIEKPLSQQYVLAQFKEYAELVGIQENIGTHSLRKTWAYFRWKAGHDISLIQEALNHSSLKITRKYIGIQQEDLQSLYESIEL